MDNNLLSKPHQIVKKHWNNSSAVVDELLECVWPLCRVGAWSDNNIDRINFFLTVDKNSIVFYIAWNKYKPFFLGKIASQMATTGINQPWVIISEEWCVRIFSDFAKNRTIKVFDLRYVVFNSIHAADLFIPPRNIIKPLVFKCF